MEVAVEEDPKEAARKERKTPQVEKLLRQFMDLDGPKGTSKAYRANYDSIFEADCFWCKCHKKKSEMRGVDQLIVNGETHQDVFVCHRCFTQPPVPK